jgi:hypothetical protein
MKMKFPERRTRLNLIGAFILIIGLTSAAWIYHGAVQAARQAEYANEGRIIEMPENTKKYRHDLELYGGKANVMMADFVRWLSGLWQGKSLAKFIAFLSLVIASAFFYTATHPPIPPESETGSKNQNENLE